MKISIITICFNNEADIRPTIESVVNQTYPDIEYIIVDGASKDKTLDIVNAYQSQISKIISEPDKGLYDAINTGIQNATGDVVGLIHAGDRLYGNHVIEKLAKHFEENDIDISYGYAVTYNQNDKIVRIGKTPEYHRTLVRLGWMPSHQSIYIKREIFDLYGYYNLNFHPYSDYELFVRFFYFTELKIKKIDLYVNKFYLGGISTNSTKRKLKLRKLILDVWRCHGQNPPPFLLITKTLWVIWRNMCAFCYNLKLMVYSKHNN
ncbi:glycosyl transferase [Bacteroidia bacterium]|nr:glycosyl transferase [Bacteroidia bacterium]